MRKNNFDIFDYILSLSNDDETKSHYKSKVYKVTWEKLVLTYLIGGLVGTIWEVCLTLYKHHIFEFRNGSFFTPFNPVYGFGLCAIILFLHKLNTTKQIFFVGAVVGGSAEYILNFLQEKILGSRSWDYSNRFLNINGRTTIPYCIFWGFGCVLVMKFIYPFIFEYISKIKPKAMKILGIVFIIVIIIDLFMTTGGLMRYNLRHEGIEPYTFIGKFFDYFFDDNRVELFFPNMKLT